MKTKFITIKRVKSSFLVLFCSTLFFTLNPDTAKGQNIDAGFDIYSTYIFRGVAFSGPSIQPYVEFSAGNLSIGAWGSQGIDGYAGEPGFQEMDLYASYEFDFGLRIGFTDYYYPGTEYFDGDSHAFELNLGLDISNLALSGNYIFNEAEGAGSEGGDLYFEAGLSFGNANLFLGAGDGWHSSNGDFKLVNVGLGVEKKIKITESFSLPITGAVILNPDTEQFYIVAGVSF